MTRQEAMEIAAGIYSSKVTEIAAECIAESSMHESDKAVLSSRLRGLQRVYDQCRAAGFIDDNGAVRKVLGELPITGDGCVIGTNAVLWSWWQPQFTDDEGFAQCSVTNGVVSSPGGCYSTKEAAEDANTEAVQ